MRFIHCEYILFLAVRPYNAGIALGRHVYRHQTSKVDPHTKIYNGRIGRLMT